jgi:hypothetical protein
MAVEVRGALVALCMGILFFFQTSSFTGILMRIIELGSHPMLGR